jgi:adenosyl cobinamide kinase/adenosyl cobinamide phosphate guanylyltransferase
VIALVLGGARSGKSEVAEGMACLLPQPVTYVATAFLGDGAPDGGDPDLVVRVAAHRARRPPAWRTLELDPGSDLAGVTGQLKGTVLVDSLGMWLAGADERAGQDDRLCRELVARPGDTVIVSDEVGLGVHPSSPSGLVFRDALGELNRRVAAVADDVVLVVAGRVLPLQPAPARPGGR